MANSDFCIPTKHGQRPKGIIEEEFYEKKMLKKYSYLSISSNQARWNEDVT